MQSVIQSVKQTLTQKETSKRFNLFVFKRHCLLMFVFICLFFTSISKIFAANATLNLKETDIQVFIESVSRITGKTFIVDPRVKNKKVTVISQHEMNEKEIFALFLSVLNVNQFIAVETSKNVYKIRQQQAGKQSAVPVYSSDNKRYSGDQLITRVIKVDNADSAQLAASLRQLVSTTGDLRSYKPTNVLIVHDTAANVERIVKILKQIDKESNEDIQVIPLQYASAGEIVRILETLEKKSGSSKGSQAQKTRFVADERTNSILLSADKKSSLRLRALIAKLDSQIENNGNTKVIYLKYANAADLATLLEGVGESIGEDKDNKPKPARRSGNQKDYSIKAHEETNSLVITAAPDVMRSFEAVIGQLDIRRKQVNVEAVIVEISESKNKQLGIQWVTEAGLVNFTNSSTSIAGVAGGAVANRGTNNGVTRTFDPTTGVLVSEVENNSDGDNGAALAQALSGATGLLLGFTDDRSWAGLVQALATDTDSNVLSRPNLTTMDNEEASFSVGQEVPVLGGATFGSNNSNPFQNVERKDVGIKLKITPQINEGDAIKLTIEQEVSSIAGTTATDIITNKRQITTTILAGDGQTVVLGGLIDEDIQESAQKVPLLGDLPLIGSLFSSNATTKVKRNLMVFIRAKIINDGADFDTITSRKYNYIRAHQLDMQQRGVSLMPGVDAAVLPEWNDDLALPPSFTDALKEYDLDKNGKNKKDKSKKE